MSKRDIETVCQLSAHLALRSTWEKMGDVNTRAPKCAADAMRLQRLGRRSRNNAAKRWLPPGMREVMPEYDVQPYLDECGRISREVERVVSPYGWQLKDFCVSTEGVTFFAMPGEHATKFGKGLLI